MDLIVARQHPHLPERLQWRREAADGSSVLGEGGWEDLAAASADARLVWLVPGEDVLLSEVSIANRRELKRAAPYALEDELAEDIDTLHFAYGKAAAKAPVPVAITARARMSEWLDTLKAHGIRPHALVPDTLSLPWREDHACIVLEDGRGLIRSDAARGLAADAGAAGPLIEAELAEKKPATVQVWRGPDATVDTPRLDVPVEETRWQGNLLEILPTGWGRTPTLNLLQGEFRPQSPGRRHMHWWVAAALATVWLLFSFTLDVMHYRDLSTVEAEYQDAMRELYFATFPDARRAPDPRLLMEQRLEAMRQDTGATERSAFLGLLDTTAAVVTAGADTRVTSLRYRDNRLDIELDAADAGTLDGIKQAIESRGLSARLQSVDTQGDRVTGRLYVEP